jgi:hypothetical protein
MTRAEHVAWVKARAVEELETNGPIQAFALMISDLGKHPETIPTSETIRTGTSLAVSDAEGRGDGQGVRTWIESIN